MTIINPNTYPLDYSGVASSNLIANEQVTLSGGAFRAFSPLYAPFFKKNIAMIDLGTGLRLTSSQYSCKALIPSASTVAGIGDEVYALVVITDAAVSNNLSVSYQTVGGPYTSGFEAILGMVTNLLSTNQVSNNDPVNWAIVEHLPTGFPENLHLHSLGQTTGWEFLAAALEKLRLTILLGDQLSKSFVLSYIDRAIAAAIQMSNQIAEAGTPLGDHVASTDNPHNVTAAQLGLGLVQNFAIATLQEAYEGTRTDRYLTADLVQAVVQSRIDLGLDAHILATDNPHNVTKAQVGLSDVANYGIAVADDLNTPVNGTNLYVTNVTAAAWLVSYFTELTSSSNTTLAATTQSGVDALAAAQAALSDAQAALAAAQVASSTITAATQQASAALLAANANLLSVQNSQSAAMNLVNDYVAQALIAAEAAAYSRGFTDGIASRS